MNNRYIDLLITWLPVTAITAFSGGIMWFLNYTPSSSDVEVVAEETVITEVHTTSYADAARECANSVEEQAPLAEAGKLGYTPLGTVLSFEYDGTDTALSHERVHMFQVCTRTATVMSEEYYSVLPRFHKSVTAYALRGAGLTELRMEHEAWVVQENCSTEWNSVYTEWRAGTTSTEEAALFLRTCISK